MLPETRQEWLSVLKRGLFNFRFFVYVMLIDVLFDSLKVGASLVTVYFGGWIAAVGLVILLYIGFVGAVIYKDYKEKNKTPLD